MSMSTAYLLGSGSTELIIACSDALVNKILCESCSQHQIDQANMIRLPGGCYSLVKGSSRKSAWNALRFYTSCEEIRQIHLIQEVECSFVKSAASPEEQTWKHRRLLEEAAQLIYQEVKNEVEVNLYLIQNGQLTPIVLVNEDNTYALRKEEGGQVPVGKA